MGLSENQGTLFWDPYNKDPTIWGAILGSPFFGTPPGASGCSLQFASNLGPLETVNLIRVPENSKGLDAYQYCFAGSLV